MSQLEEKTEVKPQTKVCLIVIDGWGLAPASQSNAITLANAPIMKHLTEDHLSASIAASGISVGLPAGVMGNSEVGHLTIGAGRVNFQDLERINFSIEDKTFFKNPELLAAFDYAKKNKSNLHLMGLVSNGGVHSHIEHLKQIIIASKDAGVPTYLHFFADGRDTAPALAPLFLKEIQDFMSSQSHGEVVTVAGRYYAMDRDNRWGRIELVYNALTAGECDGVTKVTADGLADAIAKKQAAGETDEFIKPVVVVDGATGAPVGRVRDNDSIIFFNYRADRMREIVSVFGMHKYPFEKVDDEGKSSTVKLSNVLVTQMTQYDSKFTLPTLFKPLNMRDGLAEWISKAGLRQFHTAETEKYAHVTFFFNGGIEAAFENEDRLTVSSPKVATYDLKPEMNAEGVAKSVAEGLASDKNYAFVMCNFAPPDMVGHTGVLPAAIKGVEATDKAIGEILEACKKHDYTLVITADHGNAEKMLSDDGVPHTAHTSNPVPFLIHLASPVAGKYKFNSRAKENKGEVKDVAPTILDLMQIKAPAVMTGESLLERV